MKRTTIMLPDNLKNQVTQTARNMGISLGQFIREAVEAKLWGSKLPRMDDPLLSDDAHCDTAANQDLAANHDACLYGDS